MADEKNRDMIEKQRY